MVLALLSMGPRLAEIYVVAIKNLDACRNCSSDFMAKFLVVLTDLSNRLQQPSGKGSSGGSGGSANSANANSSSRVEGTGLGAWVWVTGELQRTQELIDMKNNGDRLAYPLDQHPRTYTPSLSYIYSLSLSLLLYVLIFFCTCA